MSLGNNKVLKATWWSGHSATSGNWTVNWFGGQGLLWHLTCLGTALWILGPSHFLRRWYLQRSTDFQRGDSRFGDGEIFWQVSLIQHVDVLRVDPNVCLLLTVLRCLLFFLKIFPSSVLTSCDVTSTCCSTHALEPSTPFTCTISFLLRWEEFLGTGVVMIGSHVVFSSRALLGQSQLFWVWGARWS